LNQHPKKPAKITTYLKWISYKTKSTTVWQRVQQHSF